MGVDLWGLHPPCIEESHPTTTPHGPLRVTASIGVAAATHDHPTLQRLGQRADEAMYAAKRAGRNRVSTLEVAGGLGA